MEAAVLVFLSRTARARLVSSTLTHLTPINISVYTQMLLLCFMLTTASAVETA
jgi:hypothetical protein